MVSDSFEKAKLYCEGRREVLPRAYTANKMKHVFDDVKENYDDDENNEEEINIDDKEKIRETIEKMRKMDGIYIDLNDSDIDDFQEILSGDENEFDDPDVFFPENVSTSNPDRENENISMVLEVSMNQSVVVEPNSHSKYSETRIISVDIF